MNDNIYKLKYPIEIRDKESGAVIDTITTLTLTRPKGKHLKAMDRAEGDVARTLALVGAVSGQPPAVMDLLDSADFAGLTEIVEDFFGGRRPTGATSTET